MKKFRIDSETMNDDRIIEASNKKVAAKRCPDLVSKMTDVEFKNRVDDMRAAIEGFDAGRIGEKELRILLGLGNREDSKKSWEAAVEWALKEVK